MQKFLLQTPSLFPSQIIFYLHTDLFLQKNAIVIEDIHMKDYHLNHKDQEMDQINMEDM
jgi:hypothetical protein